MDAASIEQMNKVRASLGLAPLPVPGGGANEGPQFKSKGSGSASEEEEEDHLSTLDKRQAAAGSNWQKLESERQERVERQKRKDAAKKARDAAQRFSKLGGRGLGEASDEEGPETDTRTWLLQQKKRQKKIDKARKMEEELAAREKEAQMAEYTSKDLAGVRVGHEAGEFDEMTGEQILTLKDAEIGDESEEDELENAELRSKEKLEERLKSKIKRPDYDPTEQEEMKAVLSKYDEEIDGKKQKRFTLDGTGNTAPASRKMLDADGEVKSKGVKISLDMLKDDAPVSDYVDPSTIKVKKPKKSKKEKKTRRKADDEDDIFPQVGNGAADTKVEDEAMDVDGATNGIDNNANKKRAFEFDDDDDLQATLAEQRRQALKKRKKMDAAELARQMREEMPVDEDNEQEEGGLTLDETTEFVANLKRPEATESTNGQANRASRDPTSSARDEADSDSDGDGDTAMGNNGDLSYAAVPDPADSNKQPEDLTATGLEEETNMSGQGLGASLSLLRKRGLIDSSEHAATISAQDRARTRFLTERQHLIDDFDAQARRDREAERAAGRWDKMSVREREAYGKQQNEARERYLNQLLDREFKANYRPEVELRYTDEFGRELNQKEAFKHMSHMFHGKGSGKLKTEKRLKRIEDEKREMGKGLLNIGDTEGGMMNVQGREGRKQGKAGVRLQ